MDEDWGPSTEYTPGLDVTRFEKHDDFIKRPFLGFGSKINPAEFSHLWWAYDPAVTVCGESLSMRIDMHLPRCPKCWENKLVK